MWAVFSVAIFLCNFHAQAHDGQSHDGNTKTIPPIPDASAVNSPALWQSTVLDAALVDQFGQEFTLNQLNGKPVLLNFFFADCVSICSRQLYELGEVFNELNSKQLSDHFAFVSVTINPELDTAEKLLQVAQKTAPKKIDSQNPGWFFVGGDMQDVNALGALLGWGRRTLADGDLDHRTNLYLLNHSGELIQQYRGVPVNKSRLVRELGFLASRMP